MGKRERNHKNRILMKLSVTILLSFLLVAILGGIFYFATTRFGIGVLEKKREEVGEEYNGQKFDSKEYNSQDLLKDFQTKDDDMSNEESSKTDEDDSLDEVENVEKEEVRDISMVFTGDVCFYDGYANMASFKSKGSNIEKCISSELLEEMRNADICMINNEFAYSNRGTPLAGKEYTLCSKPENVKILHDMGVDLVSLANNHVYDYGKDALLDTLDTLQNANVPYVGAGKNIEEASKPYIFEMSGRKIAFLSATQVERNANPETKGATEEEPGTFRCFTDSEFANLTDAIRKVDKEADLTVVYVHWGSENTDELHWAQESQAPEMVKAGADLIIGDHPHCLQNIDYIDGVPVIYSLGNYWFNSKTRDTGLFKAVLQADGNLKCQFIAAKQHDCRTDIETGEEKQRILDYMQCISPNITIDAEGYITNKPYDGPTIDYNSVQRVPPPPVTKVEIADPVTGEVRTINKSTGEVLDPATGNGLGIYVDPATGALR